MPAADVQACSQEAAAARAQSDSQSTCNALLSTYRASGFCAGGGSNASSGSGSGGTNSGSGSGGSGSGGSGSGGSGSGGSGSGGSGSGGSGSGGVVDGASLHVNSVAAPGTVNGSSAPSGTFYVVVDFTLQNVGAATPLSTTSVLFSVDTSQALVVAASSNQPSGPCGAGISVAPGGHIECQLAFTVPDGQTPATLAYDDLHGDKATAPLPAVPAPSGACDTVASWISKTPSSTCMTCLESAVGTTTGTTGTCSSATSAYSNACKTCGTSCSGNPSTSTCACERGCDSTSCQALYDAAWQCIEQACSTSCP
jgi:hypothetical protein